MEKKTTYNLKVHLLYVNLIKAYDSIPQEKLWEVLMITAIHKYQHMGFADDQLILEYENIEYKTDRRI